MFENMNLMTCQEILSNSSKKKYFSKIEGGEKLSQNFEISKNKGGEVSSNTPDAPI